MKKKGSRKKSDRQVRVEELVRQVSSNIISGETNRTSLITVTSVDMSPDFKNCTIYVSIFPETAEESAINFLKRKRPEIREHIKKNTALRNVPFVDVEIDEGEKNRQKIEDIISH